MKNKIAILFVSLFLMWSCSQVEPPRSLKYEYFPLETGKYKEYQIDSIWFDAFTESSDTLSYFIKETVQEAFKDNTGDTAFIILSEYRFSDNDAWKFQYYFTEKRTIYSAHRVENSHRKVKLIFPIQNRKKWDENEMNSAAPQINRYTNVDEKYFLNDLQFDSTLMVDQGDREDPYFRFFGEEVYAKGVGLIKKTYINTETQQEIKNGIEYHKSLRSTNY